MADIDVVPKARSSKGWVIWVVGLVLVAIALWMLLGGMANNTPQ